VGVGGAGCNAVAVSEMNHFGIISDRDREHHDMDIVRITPGELEMFRTTAPHFLTKDLPVVRNIIQRIDDKDIVFIFTGLGGETGSHTAPVLANISKRRAKLVVSIVCTPFSVEGVDRHKHASEGLIKLSLTSDLCVVLDNDGLAKAAPQMQFRKAFRVMDQVMNFVPNEMHQTLTKESLKEIREHFRDCSQCRLGVGIGKGVYADRLALQEAFESPWFDPKLDKMLSCLALFSVGNGQEYLVEPMLKDLSSRVPSATWLYAVRSDPALEDRVQVTLLVGMK
jgi:cell division protein FtsZ